MSAALAGGFAEAAAATHERGPEGYEEIRRRAGVLIDLLLGLPRVNIRSPIPAQSGLVSFELEGTAAKDVVAGLLEQGFVVRYVPAGRPFIRASTHLFNTEAELERLAEAVGAL
jgi:L-cysteine/cystine lyase